jgi:outer membrane lipoprotein-sorting protein
MEEIRKGMHDDMRKLTSYSDEWSLTVNGENQTRVSFSRFINLKQNRLEIKMDGQLVLESGFDGQNVWVLSHPSKFYADEPWKQEERSPKSFGPPESAEDGSFSFAFDGTYDFSIYSKPDLKVTTLEEVRLDDKDVRKITATATRPTGKIQVEMWFDKDRWRMVKARAHGGRTGETPTDAVMTMLKSSFEEKYTATSFVLEQSKVAGYEKKSFAELKGDGQARMKPVVQ